MNNAIEQFRQAIMSAGLDAPDTIDDDGSIHRFKSGGRGGQKSAWYVLHNNGAIHAGSFGDWRTGLNVSWCSQSSQAMTQAEREDYRKRVQAMQAERAAQKAAYIDDEARKAVKRWNAARSPNGHAYLARKGVRAHGIRQDGRTLLIPMRDTDGKLHSLQTISSNGDKFFKGRVEGCYHSIGRPAGKIIICEGYATAATVHEATGCAVAVAFTAANIKYVAIALRKKYPDTQIIIAADDDWKTKLINPDGILLDINPGLMYAARAAIEVDGVIVVPEFPKERPEKATDFNDLAGLAGLGAVWACFGKAEKIFYVKERI